MTVMRHRDLTEEILANVWKEVLGVNRIGIHNSFFELGGDSIKAIQVSSRMHRYQLKLEARDLLKYTRICQLSRHVMPLTRCIDQGEVSGELEPTPVQRWFFTNQSKGRHHFNQSMMLYSRERLDEGTVSRIFDALVKHHDALRLVCRDRYGDPILTYRGVEGDGKLYDLFVFDIRDEYNVKASIESQADELQSRVNLSEGPLVKIGLFQVEQGTHLLIIIHHLAVDGVSWRILLEDLGEAFSQCANGEPITLQAKTHSYAEWSRALKEYAQTEELKNERAYWSRFSDEAFSPLDKDFDYPEHRTRDSRDVVISLSESNTTRLITECHAAYNTEMNDLLLASLALALRSWTGESRFLIQLESHGRETVIEGLDIGRTVGWFTSIFPVGLTLPDNDLIGDAVKLVKESLRSIPNKGMGYGILKYLSDTEEEESLEFGLQSDISFNYLGQFGGEMGSGRMDFSPYSTGREVSPDYGNRCSLDINGILINGQLSFTISFSTRQYLEQSILTLGKLFNDKLNAVIEHCSSRQETEHTPSDFSSKDLDFDTLRDVFSALENL
ncbi:condensation domain-containing protein [Paenibacillus melissococcoides]|uniref:Condensation domain-containing protein n=2 Tax=Paenibacillus melissococcoides TaxID=2912268 RepID=A0ABN8UEH9_9BACL|nr:MULTISPECIES: condensation domain-containing protein [Paenibacillus]CAH8249525.1 condensation domain-containing protein [Paenibacillus melissococcoides]